MAKLKIGNSTDYLQAAAQALSQQNYPLVYAYASAALAIGSVQATYYLCSYHHHQMEERVKQEASTGAVREIANFGTMYKLAEAFKVKGYKEFTSYFTGVFSKIDVEIKKLVILLGEGYKQYLSEALQKNLFDTKITLEAAESLACAMVKLTVQYAKNYQVTTYDLENLVQDEQVNGNLYPKVNGNHSNSHHHPDAKTALLGGEDHHDHQHNKDSCCVIL